jgi:hypothetical protein
MARFQTLDWGSTLLQRSTVIGGATMDVVSGDDEQARDDGDDHVDLNLGPYAVSPLRGLHFSSADDTAAS